MKRQEVKTENRHKEEGRRAVEQNDEGGSKRVGEQESGTVEVLCLAAGAARERAANDADVEPRRRLWRALGRRALHGAREGRAALVGIAVVRRRTSTLARAVPSSTSGVYSTTGITPPAARRARLGRPRPPPAAPALPATPPASRSPRSPRPRGVRSAGAPTARAQLRGRPRPSRRGAARRGLGRRSRRGGRRRTSTRGLGPTPWPPPAQAFGISKEGQV